MTGDKKLNELKTKVDDRTLEAFNRWVHVNDRTPSEALRHILNMYLFGADSLSACGKDTQSKQ